MARASIAFLARLDSAYAERPFFVGLKARLLAAILLLLIAVVPCNLVKVALVQPPEILPRVIVNLLLGAIALVCLRSVFRGQQ